MQTDLENSEVSLQPYTYEQFWLHKSEKAHSDKRNSPKNENTSKTMSTYVLYCSTWLVKMCKSTNILAVDSINHNYIAV